MTYTAGAREDDLKSSMETKRRHLSRNTDAKKKSQLGQFLTPNMTAKFMADLFPAHKGHCRLLDAGAGIGSLSSAFLERWQQGSLRFKNVEVDAFEIDKDLCPHLAETFEAFGGSNNFTANIFNEDFIHLAVQSLSGSLFNESLASYTHAILNPPYKKIRSESSHRLALRSVGIETVNLYTAFVALSVALLAPGGQLVAIIPRSFCNGPYYLPFRKYILDRTAVRHLHLFDSRNSAFKDDQVLQENIIIRLERNGKQGPVTVSTSTDDTFADLVTYTYPFERIVVPKDAEKFIYVPTSKQKNVIESSRAISFRLADLGLSVSTGPVVDYRMKTHLREMPEPGTVPLLYPVHFSNRGLTWPIQGMKKPNAIERTPLTEKWFYPKGFYCVVRRFSSKEEKRRIVASVVDPRAFGDVNVLGFENHLNLIHENKQGMPEALAHGLAVFLNTTAVDEVFRSFNGHTQVNATDLKLMKYPSRDSLITLGKWAMKQKEFTQPMLDAQLEVLTG